MVVKKHCLKVPLLNSRYKKHGIEILDAVSVVKEQGEAQITLDLDLKEKSSKWRRKSRRRISVSPTGRDQLVSTR